MPRPIKQAAEPNLDEVLSGEQIAINVLLKGLMYDPKEIIRPKVSPETLLQEAEELSKDLRKFIPASWGLVEPSVFIPNWHIDAIAEHLQAITDGDIQDLLITMPPRHSKSLIVSVIWPAYEWINIPGNRWVFNSYAFNLSVRDSIKRRKIIQSLWYQDRWADKYALIDEQNTKIRYENDKHGFMLASSVGGSNTGEGGERIIADDPHNVKKAESEVERTNAVEWWNVVMSTRRNNNLAARVVVQQRVHEGDVAGDIIEKGGYVHLNLPTEFGFAGAPRCRTGWTVKSTGEQHSWEDPREAEGELLNPARFTHKDNEEAKINLGDYQYACTPAGTPILMADWKCKPIEEVQPGDEIVGFETKGANAGGGEPQRQRMFKSKVVRTFSYQASVHDLTMASGRKVRCTADHKWWTRRHPTVKEPGRKSYMPPAVGRQLWFVCPPDGGCSDDERNLWCYLAGIVDGEGSVKSNTLEISQSPTSNGPTFTKIIEVLSALGLKFNVLVYPSNNPKWGDRGMIQVNQPREVYRNLLRYADPGKRDEMLDCLYGRNERLASEGDYVLAIGKPGPVETVYALETETGNYVAWGYASSNSQHGQNPTPPKGQIIQAQWLKYYGGPDQPGIPDWEKCNHQFMPMFSLDCAFKEKKDTDFVAGLGFAMFGADVYLMPIAIHKRMNFPDTVDAVAEFCGGENLEKTKTFPGVYPFMKLKLVEDKANGSAIIDTLRHRIPGMVPFEPGGASKESRLMSASWRFRAGNVYLPHESIAPWIKEYVYELCVAAGTNVNTIRGLVPIELVVAGDKVLTRSGYSEVTKSCCTSAAARVVEIGLSDGKTLKVTHRHPIWRRGYGFTEASRLQVGDVLLSSTEASSLYYTPSQSERGGILPITDSATCTRSYTAVRLVRYLRGFWYTTKTVTRGTINWTTSSVSRLVTTLSTITQRLLDHQQQKHASSVVIPTLPFSLATREPAHSDAATPSLTDVTPRYTTNRATAAENDLDALRPNNGFADEIVVTSICELNILEPVYNLEVTGAHEFFANGVLVHNCAFPKAKKDDYVDATSQVLLFIGGDQMIEGAPIMTEHTSKWFSIGEADFESGSVWGQIASGGGGKSRWRG